MENSFVPDLISLQQQCDENPEDKKLAEMLEQAVEWMRQKYDDVMEIQFYMIMYSEGAMSLKEVDEMVVPERTVFLYKLKDVQQAREDNQKRLSEGG